MPTRIKPMDVQMFAGFEELKKGEHLYNINAVKHRFQSNYGLQATVRDKDRFRVEMIVEGEQLFGRCTCPAGSHPCEHQVATLMTWIHEPRTFVSYLELRKAIRKQDKNSLIDLLMSLSEVFPEITQFFIETPETPAKQVIQQEISDIFNNSKTKHLSSDVLDSTQIMLIRAKHLRNKGNWELARTIYFEILDKLLGVTDNTGTAKPFTESFVAEMADNFEECAINEPDFASDNKVIQSETKIILDHPSAENQGVFLDELKEKLDL